MRPTFPIRAATAAALVCLAAPAAHASPIVVGSYYEDNTSCSSAGGTACFAYFSKIPGGEAVLITQVTCHVEINPGLLSRARLGLLTREEAIDPNREADIPRSPVSTISPVNYYQVGGAVSFLYRPRETPYIRINSTSSVMFVSCRITGQRPSPL